MLADAEPAPAPPQRAHLLVVPKTPAAVVALARSDARVVAHYGSFTLVSSGDDDSLRAAGAQRRDDMRQVATAAGDFDPARRSSLAAKAAPDRDEVLALVQYVGPPKAEWLDRLRATGALIVTYQAENAYVVHARGTAVDRLAGLVGTDPAVRAVVPLGAADKVEGAAGETARYAVSTIASAAAVTTGRRVGASDTVRGLRTQYLELSPSELGELAREPAVVAIERDFAPAPTDERADQIVAGSLVAPALTQPSPPGYLSWHNSKIVTPFDATIDVTDSGVDNGAGPTDHPDFHVLGSSSQPERIAYRQNYTADADTRDCTGHGSSLASLAAGFNSASGGSFEDSAGYNYGLGVAPLAQIGVSKIFNCAGVAAPFTPSTVASNAYSGGATISNNSWGAGGPLSWGVYSSRARAYDALVRDAQSGTGGNQEMVQVFSSGNDGGTGEGTILSEATAKNVITVGASEGVRPSGTDGCGNPNARADNAREVASFSSRGPTDDGRLKPDLVAPGTHLTAARPTGGSYTGIGTCNPVFVSNYSLVSGTSQAAPLVSGAAALVRDWYEDNEGAAPSPALTKALLINTATDLSGGPNDEQGWGRVNVGSAFDSTARRFYDQQPGDVLTNPGQTVVRSFSVPDTSKPVKVTLAWTDAVGPPTGNAFVNDLDLEVANGGRTYRGNVFNGAWSRAGGSADPRDNVESVYLPAGTSGRFSVTVRATTLGGDGLPGSGDSTDQDFALVVSNASEAPAPVLVHSATTVSGGDGDGVLESDESVGLTEQVRNTGNTGASGLSGTLTGSGGLSVTQGSSAYPGIASDGGVGSNSTAFAAHLANAASCGADAAATLSIAGAGGTQVVPVVLPTGAPGPLQITSSSTAVAIPDDSNVGASSSVFVAERGRIKDLNVTLPSPGIVHPSDGDLVIDLIGPDGTTVRLADHPGGPDNSGDNFSGTIFDDDAAQSISQGTPPYTGNFRPQNDQLSRFDGKSRYGTWTLRVRDLFAGDVGTLRAWGVASQKASCNVDTTPPDTVIGSFPDNPTSSTSATFAIGSPDSGATFECRLDFALWAPCGKSPSYRGLAPGTHLFSARAIDGSDNEDPTPATFRWKVVEPAGAAAASFVLAPAEERTSTALAGHYRVLAACASSCRLGAKLTVGKTTLATGAVRRRSRGTALANLHVSKAGRPKLQRASVLRARLTITLTQGSSRLSARRTIVLRRGAGLSRIVRQGLRLVAVSTRGSRVSGTLTVSPSQARKLGLKVSGRKRRTVAAGRVSAGRAPRLLVLRVSGSMRKALAKARRVAVRLEAVAGAAPQARRTARLSQTLVR